MVLGGLLFSLLNTIARELTLHLDVYQSQFLRYLFGLIFILPWVWRDGWRRNPTSRGRCRRTRVPLPPKPREMLPC